MPIYEYQCDQCERIHEIWQKITEDAVSACPECGGPVERLISATAFQLKGTGWYATDYKGPGSAGNKGASPAKAETDAKSTSSESATEGKKSEPATAPKSDSSDKIHSGE